MYVSAADNGIDQRCAEARRLDADLVALLVAPIAFAVAQLAGAEVVEVDIARNTVLRVLEVMVLAVGQ